MIEKLAEIVAFGALTAQNEFDPNLVTPGFEGFVLTGLLAVAAILLIFDMSRRTRRMRIRHEVAEMLDAEEAEAAAVQGSNSEGDATR